MVMGVIVLILGLTGPVLTSFAPARNLTSSVFTMADLLDQSRSYAMGNNTYVFFGVAEFDDSLSTSGTQQSGVGRVVAMAVASQDGTSIYDVNNLTAWSATSSNLTPVGNPRVFENLHLADDTQSPPAVPSTLARQSVPDGYRVGNTQFTSATPFAFPLGQSATTCRYYFTKVIAFDPQGVARVITSAGSDAVPASIEMDLQQSHGTVAPPLPSDTSSNYTALQCDGLTGSARVYR